MREGLRSGRRCEELENAIPLSSLVPKKNSNNKRKKRVRDAISDIELLIPDTEVLSLARKRLKTNGFVSGSVDKSISDQVECDESDENETTKRSRLDVFEYNEDDLVDYKKFKEELESKHNRVVQDDENHGGKAEDGGHSEAEENQTTRSAGTSFRKRMHSSLQSKHAVENLQSPTISEKNKSPSGLSSKKKKSHHTRGAEKDASLQQSSECLDPCISEENESNKGEPSLMSELGLSTEFAQNVKRKIAKHLIRDRIRSMVESAGWKIDYRPRKGRESYNDAVYVDHSGIVYWSILRAYYGLKRQYENKESSQKHHGTSFSFTPIPKVLLDQLKRRTKKAIAREHKSLGKGMRATQNIKRKLGLKSAAKMHLKKNTSSSRSRENLGSLIRQDGKSLKMRMKKKGRKNAVRRPASTHKAGNRMKSLESSKASRASNAHSLQGRKSKSQRGYSLLVRKSDKENSDGDDFMAYTRKRTVLSWLIDSEIVSIGGKIKYMNKRRTRALLEGTITSDGINCGCCSRVVTIAEFQTHAGRKLCQPCLNIFVESGASLFQCLIDAWNKQEESKRSGYRFIDIRTDDPNDDACGICGDGGDLICCDGCPSTFHQSCLGIQVLPKGDWHCFNCCCKFCGIVNCINGQGDEATVSDLLTCKLCEEKYHGSCILQKITVPVGSDDLCGSFCGNRCKELFEKLQKLLGIKHELEAGFSWTVIQRSDLESETSFCTYPQKVECNSKLGLALSVMDECFLPTIDERSGINLIQNVVYNCGSNFNRLNYSGFYTFLLERGDELISVASIRIRRATLAEMPFIGTRHIYRRQGMCRRLLNAIESALSSLNLEKLIIPAISELMDTWTRIFGFIPFEESCKHELRSLNLVVFPGVALLQKLLMKQNSIALNDGLGSKAIELERDNYLMTDATDSSDTASIVPDNLCSDVTVNHTNEIINEVVVAKTCLQAPGGFIQSTSDASNHSDATGELVSHVSKEEAECSNSQSRHEFVSNTNSVLPEVEKNPTMPTMNISFGHNLQTSIGNAADEVDGKFNDGNFNTKMDRITSDVHPSAKTSSVHTIDLNEGLELHFTERKSGSYASQQQVESSASITETNVLLPEVKEISKKTSVKCNSHDSIEAASDGRKVNMITDGVKKAPHSSVEISSCCTSYVPDECRDMHYTPNDIECHISQSQNDCPLIGLENEPTKCFHAESSVRVSAVDVVNDVQELNMITDDDQVNVCASLAISDQCTTDVIKQSSEMHPPKEDSQSWDKSSKPALRLVCTQPMMENKPAINSSAESNLQVSADDVATEVIIQNNATEPSLSAVAESSSQSTAKGSNVRLNTVGSAVCLGSRSKLNSDTYQSKGGMESKSLEVSFAKVCEPHREKIACNSSDQVIKHGKTVVPFENGVHAILDHSTGTITEPHCADFVPNLQGPGNNGTCLKTDLKCSSGTSLEIQDVQTLQQESDCNAADVVDSICEGDKIDVTSHKHKCTGCDSLSCIKAANAYVCDSSSETIVPCASEPAHKNTHHLADEPLVTFSGCTSNLKNSANGHVNATHEVPHDHCSLILPQGFASDSHDTVTEPAQIYKGSGCTSLLLRKAPGFVCDTAENFATTDEVNVNETYAAASDGTPVNGISEVL